MGELSRSHHSLWALDKLSLFAAPLISFLSYDWKFLHQVGCRKKTKLVHEVESLWKDSTGRAKLRRGVPRWFDTEVPR